MNPLLRKMLARLQAPAGDDGSDAGGSGSGAPGAAEGSMEELASFLPGDDGGDFGDPGAGGDDPEEHEASAGDGDDLPSQDDDPEDEFESGGQKIKVKRSELRAGYMKDADYRQKTAKLAEQQRAVEAYGAQLQQERQNAANQLDVYLQTLHQELLGAQPNPTLIDSDPQEFMRQQAQYNQRAQHFQKAMSERQALQQRMSAEQQQRQAMHLRQETERLEAVLPEWRNPKVRAEETKQIADYLGSVGFSQEEIGTVADHRALLIARDAAKYRQLKDIRAKQAKAPVPKPVRPGASGQSNPNSNTQRARERLARNPNDLDALAGFMGASGL